MYTKKIFSIKGVIMKDYEVKVLDEDDHIFIKTLRNDGNIISNISVTILSLMVI